MTGSSSEGTELVPPYRRYTVQRRRLYDCRAAATVTPHCLTTLRLNISPAIVVQSEPRRPCPNHKLVYEGRRFVSGSPPVLAQRSRGSLNGTCRSAWVRRRRRPDARKTRGGPGPLRGSKPQGSSPKRPFGGGPQHTHEPEGAGGGFAAFLACPRARTFSLAQRARLSAIGPGPFDFFAR